MPSKIQKHEQIALKGLDRNCDPLSEIRYLGGPKIKQNEWSKAKAIFLPMALPTGMNWDHLEKWPVTMKMYSCFL